MSPDGVLSGHGPKATPISMYHRSNVDRHHNILFNQEREAAEAEELSRCRSPDSRNANDTRSQNPVATAQISAFAQY